MKIEKRVKGRLTFKTSIGDVTLTDDNEGINELTEEQFDAVVDHPMFESMAKTSGLRVLAEPAETAKKPAKPAKSAKSAKPAEPAEPAEPASEDNSDEDAEGSEFASKNKAELIALAEEKGIQTKGLNKDQLIEAINEANAE